MSDRDEFKQRSALARIDRLITHERAAATLASEWSEQFEHALRETNNISELHTSPMVDTVEYVTSVLRDLFRQHHHYKWVGNPDGTNNVRASKILISSMFSAPSEESNLSLPSIKVMAQMSITPTTSLGHLNHVKPGYRIYSGVHMVSVQLRIQAKTGATVADLAHFIAQTLRVNSTEWRSVRWQNINDVSVTTFDDRPENAAFAKASPTVHSRTAMVSFVVAVRWSAVKHTSMYASSFDDYVLATGSINPDVEKVDGHAQEDISIAADPEVIMLSVPYE
jgi:hypothetical protein